MSASRQFRTVTGPNGGIILYMTKSMSDFLLGVLAMVPNQPNEIKALIGALQSPFNPETGRTQPLPTLSG